VKQANYRYRIYGLTVECPLVLDAPFSPHRPTDVYFIPATAQEFEHAHRPTRPRRNDWFRWYTLEEGSTFVCWTSVCEFLISPDGRVIRYHALERGTPDSLTNYLLTQVLSFSLLTFGIEALHGSVVTIGEGGVAFVGPSGRGKSTLSAALLARGCPVVTDDLLVLDKQRDRWLAQVGIPRMKLFPSIARHVLGRTDPQPRMNFATSKLVVALSGKQAAPRAVAVRSIYVLDDPRLTRKSTVEIEDLSGARAFLEIVRASFNLMVRDRNRLERQFTNAQRIAASVPVRRLRYPRTLSALPDVCDAVLTDLRRREPVLPDPAANHRAAPARRSY